MAEKNLYTNFVTIHDTSVSPLWNGEEVLMLATHFKIGGDNLIDAPTKTFQDVTLTTEDIAAGDTALSYLNNYDRRKSNVSYSGFSNNIINITCLYNENEIGSIATINDVSRKIFNPNKLFELILKPRTVYIKDEVLISQLSDDNDSSPAVYGSNGFPVILKGWDITPSLSGKEITMSLVFHEDKEI